MPTTWTIAVDWSRNGSFTDTNDSITDRVIEAIWFVGQKQPYQEVADNSMLTLLLDNSDGRFSPENASSPLYGSLVPLRPPFAGCGCPARRTGKQCLPHSAGGWPDPRRSCSCRRPSGYRWGRR